MSTDPQPFLEVGGPARVDRLGVAVAPVAREGGRFVRLRWWRGGHPGTSPIIQFHAGWPTSGASTHPPQVGHSSSGETWRRRGGRRSLSGSPIAFQSGAVIGGTLPTACRPRLVRRLLGCCGACRRAGGHTARRRDDRHGGRAGPTQPVRSGRAGERNADSCSSRGASSLPYHRDGRAVCFAQLVTQVSSARATSRCASLLADPASAGRDIPVLRHDDLHDQRRSPVEQLVLRWKLLVISRRHRSPSAVQRPRSQ